MYAVMVGVLGLSTLASCAPRSTTKPDNREDQASLEVSLLQYLISQRHPPRGSVVCIGIRALDKDKYVIRDPTAAHLTLVRTGGEKVVPASDCRLKDFAGGSMIHTPTGDAAVAYIVTLVRFGTNRAELNGLWNAASLAGESCMYKARKHRTRGWIVTPEEGSCVVS